MFAYVGGFTRASIGDAVPGWGPVGGGEGITAFELDERDGSLRALGVTATPDPYYLAVSTSRRVLYSASYSARFEGVPGAAVSAFRIGSDGGLTPLNAQHVPFAFLAHLALDRDERFLLAASVFGGAILVLKIAEDGRVGPLIDHARFPGSAKVPPGAIPEALAPTLPRVDPRFGHTTPHCVRADLSNRYLIAGDIGMGALDVVSFDARSGALGPPRQFGLGRDATPRTVELHPNRHTVFTSNELESTVSAHEFDPATGAIREVQRVATLPSGVPLATDWQIRTSGRQMAGGAVIDQAGRFLYVSNRGAENSIASFAIDPQGRLDLLAITSVPGVFPAEIALTPDGRFLFAPNTHSDNLAAFGVDTGTGMLTALGSTEVPNPTSIAFSA